MHTFCFQVSPRQHPKSAMLNCPNILPSNAFRTKQRDSELNQVVWCTELSTDDSHAPSEAHRIRCASDGDTGHRRRHGHAVDGRRRDPLHAGAASGPTGAGAGVRWVGRPKWLVCGGGDGAGAGSFFPCGFPTKNEKVVKMVSQFFLKPRIRRARLGMQDDLSVLEFPVKLGTCMNSSNRIV